MKFSTNEILLSKRKKWTKQNSISGCNASTTPFLLSPKHYLSNYIFLGHFNKVGFHFVGKWLLRGSGGSTERHYSERSSAKRQLVLRISLRILIGFYKDFTNFYGFVKKMVQKNQYTYNVPPGSSAPASINEARRAEFDGTGWTGWTGWTDGHEECPLILFIICGYLELVYMSVFFFLSTDFGKLSPPFFTSWNLCKFIYFIFCLDIFLLNIPRYTTKVLLAWS